MVIFAIIVVVAMVVAAAVAWWFVSGAENRDKTEVADAATASMRSLVNTNSFSELNGLVCEEYKSDPDSVKMADDLLGDLSEATGFDRLKEEMPQSFSADDVELAKEGDRWLFCDPEFDMTEFDGLPSLDY
ncbi:hypothetical protein [uncultured Corynebacterium sp.]|uniref:hypothetical protein n=1 Tax=uncultured Corynebacterium sp. TaxID=159447 RepID=UPI0025EE67C6|nr:hypothetical protein [uncultured Corynebacterium sp.]